MLCRYFEPRVRGCAATLGFGVQPLRGRSCNKNAQLQNLRVGAKSQIERFQIAFQMAEASARGMIESFPLHSEKRSNARYMLTLRFNFGQTLYRHFGQTYVGIIGQSLCRVTEPRPPAGTSPSRRHPAFPFGCGQRPRQGSSGRLPNYFTVSAECFEHLPHRRLQRQGDISDRAALVLGV